MRAYAVISHASGVEWSDSTLVRLFARKSDAERWIEFLMGLRKKYEMCFADWDSNVGALLKANGDTAAHDHSSFNFYDIEEHEVCSGVPPRYDDVYFKGMEWLANL